MSNTVTYSDDGATVTFSGSDELTRDILTANELTGVTKVVIQGYTSIYNYAFEDFSDLTSIGNFSVYRCSTIRFYCDCN